MHPLTPDLTQLKDEELHKKLSELTQVSLFHINTEIIQ